MKECNTEKVQQGMSATLKSATYKEDNMRKVHQGKSVA